MIRLISSNYSIWKPRMEDILYCKDLYAPIDGNKSKPKDMSEAEWKIMHRKTVALIRQWVDQSVFHHVSQAGTKKSEKSAEKSFFGGPRKEKRMEISSARKIGGKSDLSAIYRFFTDISRFFW